MDKDLPDVDKDVEDVTVEVPDVDADVEDVTVDVEVECKDLSDIIKGIREDMKLLKPTEEGELLREDMKLLKPTEEGELLTTPRSSYSYDFEPHKNTKKLYKLYHNDELDEIENEKGVANHWNPVKKHRIHKILLKLKFNRIVTLFYLNKMKQDSDYWGWLIIVISTIVSGMTVANNVRAEPFEGYHTMVNISLTFSSMGTSLIAAYIKKQKYTEIISDLDKYLLGINRLCEEIEIELALLEIDRTTYGDFKKKYIPEMMKFASNNPLIPPEKWKENVRDITMNYPELINPDDSEPSKLWPWFGDLVEYEEEDGTTYVIRQPTSFLKYMMKQRGTDRILSSCCLKSKQNEGNIYK